jgi:hypothetical protein
LNFSSTLFALFFIELLFVLFFSGKACRTNVEIPYICMFYSLQKLVPIAFLAYAAEVTYWDSGGEAVNCPKRLTRDTNESFKEILQPIPECPGRLYDRLPAFGICLHHCDVDLGVFGQVGIQLLQRHVFPVVADRQHCGHRNRDVALQEL